jgi:hypothetical protein
MIPMYKLSGRLGNQMFQFAFLHAQMRDGKIPDVYVQDVAYFDKYANEIKQMYGDGIEPIDQVAIHVRRGDYVGNPFYVDLYAHTDYYEKAMEQFPGAEFLVFSDDIAFCKSQVLFKDCEFSEYNDELTDFNLMAGCKGHIIANSSYSWWAAYVAPFTKKVIAPKHWYADGVERTKVPNNWERL